MADALSTRALDKCSDQSDYAEIKRLYLEQVKSYYSNRKLPMVSPYTRDVIDRIKNLIKEKRALAAAGHPSEHAKYKIVNRYEMVEQNGQDILIAKRLETRDPVIQIVPAEDSFDILMDAHLKSMHGGKDKMLQAISGKYIVPKTSIDFLLVVCKVCNQNGKMKRRADEKIPQIFNSRGQVCIIDMTSQPDNQFKHILFYLDRFTRFMLLRPLMTDTVQETAMELLKIFLDFGPPLKLETYNRPYFIKVMSLINTVQSQFDIGLVLPVKMPDITPNNVRSMLQKWQKDNGSKNWAMGCYMVQWANNSSETSKNDQAAPNASVFKTYLIQRKDSNLNEHMKPQETESNHGNIITYDLDPRDVDCNSNSPVILDCEDNSNSQITLDVDSEDVSIVNEGTELSDEDDDCLITITEMPIVPATASVPDKETRKRPNILARKSFEEDTSINELTSNKPTTSTSFKTASVTKTYSKMKKVTNPEKQVGTNELATPKNNKCHICKTGISKAYICTKCNRNVHLFCSDRLLEPNVSADVLTVTCTSCRLTNSRLEKLKRKFNEMDGDKTNITMKH